MFTPINLTALPEDVSREEREYFEYFEKEYKNPAKRHRIPIIGEVDGKRVPGFFEEPLESALLAAASELLPIWSRSQVSPVCTCASAYYTAKRTKQQLQEIMTSFSFNAASLQAIKDDESITRAVYQKLKPLRDQVFFSKQKIQETILQILLDVHSETDTNFQALGLNIVKHLKEFGVDEKLRQARIQEQQDILDSFAGSPPVRPWPPTQEPCPFCHLPHYYQFIEWLPFELPAISRAMELLVGVHVPITELPRIAEALELWIFTSDSHLFSKKKGMQTIVGTAMTAIIETMTSLKTEWISNLGSLTGIASAGTATSSSVLDGPPPSTPDITPDAN